MLVSKSIEMSENMILPPIINRKCHYRCTGGGYSDFGFYSSLSRHKKIGSIEYVIPGHDPSLLHSSYEPILKRGRVCQMGHRISPGESDLRGGEIQEV